MAQAEPASPRPRKLGPTERALKDLIGEVEHLRVTNWVLAAICMAQTALIGWIVIHLKLA